MSVSQGFGGQRRSFDGGPQQALQVVTQAVAGGGTELSERLRLALAELDRAGTPDLLPLLRSDELALSARQTTLLQSVGDAFMVQGGALKEFEACSDERLAALWATANAERLKARSPEAGPSHTWRLAASEELLCSIRRTREEIEGREFLAQLGQAEANSRLEPFLESSLQSESARVRLLAAKAVSEKRLKSLYAKVRERFLAGPPSAKENLAPVLADLQDTEADRLLLAEYLRLLRRYSPGAENLLAEDPWHSPGLSGSDWASARVLRALGEAIRKHGSRFQTAIIAGVRSAPLQPEAAPLVKLLTLIQVDRVLWPKPEAGREGSAEARALLEELARAPKLPPETRKTVEHGLSLFPKSDK
jgi:hypothetical protein